MKYKDYFNDYKKNIYNLLSSVSSEYIEKSVELIKKTKNNSGKVYVVGNGGSSSIASHVSVDLAKAAKIPSATFNNSNLITCFVNDYGYENWVTEAIKAYISKKDSIILISSSGVSKNIVNAAKFCNENNIDLITLSGFNSNNPLSKLGKINFHINSTEYNYIEMSHHIILLAIVDIFVKKL